MRNPEQQSVAARSSVYRLLASLFARELTEENIVGFRNKDGAHLLDALEKVESCAALGKTLKAQFAKTANPGTAALDLAESYAWNFHGVGGPGSPSLYASTYLSKRRSTHQETESELRKIMTAHGLYSVNSDDVPYDHLSIILEFVAWLDEKGAHAEPDEVRQKVIDQYLLSWLPAFVSQCQQTDRLGFYAEIAALALDFVKVGSVRTKQTDISVEKVLNF